MPKAGSKGKGTVRNGSLLMLLEVHREVLVAVHQLLQGGLMILLIGFTGVMAYLGVMNPSETRFTG